MRNLDRLIDGLLRGDTFTIYVLVFAVGGTIVIFATSEILQRRRRQQRSKDVHPSPIASTKR
jgi:hypothetical protein